MDLLLILTYSAICIAVFKIFKIPLNKWTVPTAALGGIIIIGLLLVVMNYNHPYSEMSRQYFVTTPIIPAVSGMVINVPVKSNVLLKAGDVLFQLDPTPYQNRLNSLHAQRSGVLDDLKRAQILVSKGALPERERDTLQARADQLQADEANAVYELQQTTVRAPSEGFVTQLALRPGMYVVAAPFRPVMIFVHNEAKYCVGWFRQNSLLRLKVGDQAEVIFDGIPGVIFSGVVKTILPVIAEGQVVASANLMDAGPSFEPGRIPVLIEVTDPNFIAIANRLPGGASGQMAIYTDHFHHVAIMRKVLLRMAAWMNYIFPFH